ncbi:MAG: hypothetical protein C4539_12410, partial [Ignavibacteriales bacterium]
MKILKLFFLLITLNAILYAQDSEGYELSAILFHGNRNIATSELENVVQSKETPGWFLKFLHSIYENIGRPPSYFDTALIPIDVEALKNYY